MSYPKFLYHKSELPKIVESKEEHEALGNEWAEVPFESDESKPLVMHEEPVKKVRKKKDVVNDS
jgi:hypothetical protein